MLKILYCFLTLGFFLLDPAYSHKYSEDGILPDFKSMLASPNIGTVRTDRSFATRVTRPFAQDSHKDTRFFSEPRVFYNEWNKEYQTYRQANANINALNILRTMGVSERGILNDDKAREYKNISDAQKIGMMKIIKGDLGFRTQQITAGETVIIARELLNMGRSMEHNDLVGHIDDLVFLHNNATDIKQKQHFQISALLLLAGHDLNAVSNPKWWQEKVEGQEEVDKETLRKITEYAETLLPPETAPVATFQQNIKDTVIARTKFEEPGKSNELSKINKLGKTSKTQHIWATNDIQGSPLHADSGLARYPDIMNLGSLTAPFKLPKNMFSIAAQVSPNHYFVVMEPENKINKDILLRPQYMEAKGGGVAGTTNVKVKYSDQQTELLTIDWSVDAASDKATSLSELKSLSELNSAFHFSTPQVKPTEKQNNDGSLNTEKLRKFIDQHQQNTYSFIALIPNQNKYFYYWCPTMLQMRELQRRAEAKQSFTLGELYSWIDNFDEDMAVPQEIKKEILDLLNRNLQDFSN